MHVDYFCEEVPHEMNTERENQDLMSETTGSHEACITRQVEEIDPATHRRLETHPCVHQDKM